MSRILILGANGYVGARLFIDLRKDYDVVGTYHHNQIFREHQKLDITNVGEIDKLVREIKPEVIIHSANNPSSKWCNLHPQEARALNQDATNYLVDISNKYSTKIIYISTMGAISPSNYYQETKYNSENIIKNAKSKFIILQPSVGVGLSPNITSENFFNKLLDSYKRKEKIVADTSLKFQPTHLGHISEVISACISNQIWNKTIPISVSKSLSRYDIAKDIFSGSGVSVEPFDEGRGAFNGVEDIDEQLTRLHLPVWSYSKLIDVTKSEVSGLSK